MRTRRLATLTTALITATSLIGITGSASAQAAEKATPKPTVVQVVEVISGELVRVQHGKDEPYVVHVLGVTIPQSGCESRAAKQDLKQTLKPGRRLVVIDGGKAPDRDGQGYALRFLGKGSGGKLVSVGLTQIAKGYADADSSIDYPFKGRYVRVEKAATKQGLGYHGSCA